MKISTRIALSVILSLAVVTSGFAEGERYVVITNVENQPAGTDVELKKKVRQLFLKERFRWDNGFQAIPLGLSKDNEAYASFSEEVLRMDDNELGSYWLSKKLSSGEGPPRNVDIERLVLRLVARDKGSFGIISKDRAVRAVADGKAHILFEFGS